MEQTSIKNRVVGVDISLERTTYAIVDVRGNIIAQDYFDTDQYESVNEYVAALSERIILLTEANGGYDTIRSMGISSPSGNYLTGGIENPPNLRWPGVTPLAAMLRDRLGIAVALGNDAHVTALGEHVFGSAHGMKNFIVVSLGYGIGSCIFSHGEAHLGADGFAGEFGHACVVPNGRMCGCGRMGCLEAYCGDKGIKTTAHELLAQSQEPSLMRELDHISPRTICKCCEQGDKLAIEVFRRTGHILGVAIANYASIVDPEVVILTGGISKAGHWLLDPAIEAFDKHVFRNIRGHVKILCSSIDDRERDVLGASALAWGIKEYSLFK